MWIPTMERRIMKTSILAYAVWVCCLTLIVAGAELPNDVLGEGPRYQGKEELKKMHPKATEWVTCEYQGMDFLFCLEVYPQLNIGRVNLWGWFFDPADEKWKELAMFRTRAVFSAEIVLDTEHGLCKLRGKGNNKFKGKDVLILNLDVTVLK
jgi:hypothetical protein